MTQMTRSAATRLAVNCHAECRLTVATPGEGFTDLTREAAAFLGEVRARDGLLTAFCRHTSASLTLQENADPDVRHDLIAALRALAPRDFGWVHATEGPDDMPAHVRTLISGVSLAVPVTDGRMALGTWQGLYLIEHRARPHRREIVFTFSGRAEELA